MAETDDMTTPVTRGELRIELTELRTELRTELQRLEVRFDDKLETWGGALVARITATEERMIGELTRLHRETLPAMEARILAEMARHTRASHEASTTQLAVVDDKYADLPRRVARLEARVFRPRPARSRR